MEKRSNKKPSLRFKGFTEYWESHKLKEVALYRNGKAHEDSITDDGKFIVVNSKFVSTNGEVVKTSNAQNEPLYKNEIAFVLSDVPNGRAIARTFLVDQSGKYTLNQRIAGITPLENTFPYFLHVLMNRHKYFLSFDDGAKQTNLSVKDVMGFESNYPKYKEQERIGELFKQLDNMIILHQRRHDKFMRMREALFEKMFPKDGDVAAPLRFKGYGSVWQKKTLGKIGTTYTGLSGKTKDDFGHGEARFVTYVNVFKNPIADIKGVDFVEIDASQNIVKSGDVLFTTSSETPEEVGMSSVWLGDTENTYLNSFCFGYRLFSSEKIDPLYLAYLLRSPEIRKQFQFLAQGISRYNISKTKVMDIVISVPEDYEEQVKIGKLFFNLDKLIELTQKKHEKLESLKKAMLNKMFV